MSACKVLAVLLVATVANEENVDILGRRSDGSLSEEDVPTSANVASVLGLQRSARLSKTEAVAMEEEDEDSPSKGQGNDQDFQQLARETSSAADLGQDVASAALTRGLLNMQRSMQVTRGKAVFEEADESARFEESPTDLLARQSEAASSSSEAALLGLQRSSHIVRGQPVMEEEEEEEPREKDKLIRTEASRDTSDAIPSPAGRPSLGPQLSAVLNRGTAEAIEEESVEEASVAAPALQQRGRDIPTAQQMSRTEDAPVKSKSWGLQKSTSLTKTQADKLEEVGVPSPQHSVRIAEKEGRQSQPLDAPRNAALAGGLQQSMRLSRTAGAVEEEESVIV